MVHPVDTADIAALDGVAVADTVISFLGGSPTPEVSFSIVAGATLRWVTPSVYRFGDVAPARNRILGWVDSYIAFPRVELRQQGTLVATVRTWWPATPGRVFRIPATILKTVDPTKGEVTVSVS